MSVPPRPELTDYERRHFNVSAQRGVLLIRGLDDLSLLMAARDSASPAFCSIRDRMDAGTNPAWITGRCAETAYERGLIDEQELDWITR